MIELNVKFLEKYKRLDAICKDMFSSKDGVTQYISVMENTDYRYSRYIGEWDEIHRQLKHLRWIRNQLSHEMGAFESEICTETDIKWIDYIYKCIINRTDPLAKVGQLKRQQEAQRHQSKQQNTTAAQSAYTTNTTKENKVSLWEKIKAKIKKWFS